MRGGATTGCSRVQRRAGWRPSIKVAGESGESQRQGSGKGLRRSREGAEKEQRRNIGKQGDETGIKVGAKRRHP